jgi:quercetin dioxygenase-like cupin family protein
MLDEGYLNVNSVMVVPKRKLSEYSSRILRIEPGGHTAFHEHSREHIIIVLMGAIKVETKNEVVYVSRGTIINISSGVMHRFFNNTNKRTVLLIQNLFQENRNLKQVLK